MGQHSHGLGQGSGVIAELFSYRDCFPQKRGLCIVDAVEWPLRQGRTFKAARQRKWIAGISRCLHPQFGIGDAGFDVAAEALKMAKRAQRFGIRRISLAKAEAISLDRALITTDRRRKVIELAVGCSKCDKKI